jgi:hypothetical protein
LQKNKNGEQYLSVEICCSKVCFNSIAHIDSWVVVDDVSSAQGGIVAD